MYQNEEVKTISQTFGLIANGKISVQAAADMLMNEEELVGGFTPADAPNIAGPERRDLTPAEIAQSFQDAARQFANNVPYINKDWINDIASQIGNGANVGELAALAKQNRDDYATDHRIDAGGDFDTWDTILRSLQPPTYTSNGYTQTGGER